MVQGAGGRKRRIQLASDSLADAERELFNPDLFDEVTDSVE
jgi:hypothetical protein